MTKKHLITFCFFATAACWGTSAAYAGVPTPQDAATQPAPGDASTQPRTGWPTAQDTVTRMSEKLNLTDDQKTKITPIVADRQQQMRALMNDSGRRMQKARKAKSIMSDSDKKIEAVLTSDQKKTYQQMKEQMRDEVRERSQSRDSGTPQQ